MHDDRLSSSGPAQRGELVDRLAFSIRRFADLHDISRTTVYEEIRAGRLRVMKVGSRTLISAQTAAEWRKERERPLTGVAKDEGSR